MGGQLGTSPDFILAGGLGVYYYMGTVHVLHVEPGIGSSGLSEGNVFILYVVSAYADDVTVIFYGNEVRFRLLLFAGRIF